MLKTILYCDLCNRPIDDFKKLRRFKFKEHDGLWGEWAYIDAHASCVQAVCEAAMAACKEREGEEG